jgi:hypothetical protein
MSYSQYEYNRQQERLFRHQKEQEVLLRKQAEELRRQTESLEESNRIEKDRVKIEKRRLQIETQRFEADELERELRNLQNERIKHIRNHLAECVASLDRLKRDSVSGNRNGISGDQFLRQVAILQAKLGMIESQSGCLVDLADMEKIQFFKSSLGYFIREKASEGKIPPNPLQILKWRLEEFRKFYKKAGEVFNYYNDWAREWLHAIPFVTLSSLHATNEKLNALERDLPDVKIKLKDMIRQLDWDNSSGRADLHGELITCAQLMGEFDLPDSVDQRQQLYDFAYNQGNLSMKVNSHLQTMRRRINELIKLHDKHKQELKKADNSAVNHDFRTGRKHLHFVGKNSFSDLNKNSVESKVEELEKIFNKISNYSIPKQDCIELSSFSKISSEIEDLCRLITRPDSELGREGLMLINKLKNQLIKSNKVFEKHRHHIKSILALATYSSIIAPMINLQFFFLTEYMQGFVWFVFYVFLILYTSLFPVIAGFLLILFANFDKDFSLQKRIPNHITKIPVFKNIFDSISDKFIHYVYTDELEKKYIFVFYVSSIYFVFLLFYKLIF